MIIFKQHITSIQEYPKKVNSFYKWVKPWVIWGYTIRKGYFKSSIFYNDAPETDPSLYIEGEKVYFKPNVVIYFNGTWQTKYFEDVKNLEEFVKRLKDGFTYIEI